MKSIIHNNSLRTILIHTESGYNWSRFARVYFFASHRLSDAIDTVSCGSWTGWLADWLLVLLKWFTAQQKIRPTDKWLRSFSKLCIIYCTLSLRSNVIFALLGSHIFQVSDAMRLKHENSYARHSIAYSEHFINEIRNWLVQLTKCG